MQGCVRWSKRRKKRGDRRDMLPISEAKKKKKIVKRPIAKAR
jgi:hypothetical protein